MKLEKNEEQKQMLKKINELKKRINPRTDLKPEKSNKKKENLLINTEKIYNFKNIIIDTIKKEKEGYTKSDGKTKSVDLS